MGGWYNFFMDSKFSTKYLIIWGFLFLWSFYQIMVCSFWDGINSKCVFSVEYQYKIPLMLFIYTFLNAMFFVFANKNKVKIIFFISTVTAIVLFIIL